MSKTLKLHLVFLMVALFGGLNVFGQNYNYGNELSSWETGDSKKLAQEYLANEETKLDDHVVYDYKVRYIYEWDEKARKPKVEEEGEVSVLALTDYTFYYGGLFQDDDIEVDYVYGVDETDSFYNLSVYKRPYEAAGIFHQDGEYVNFRLNNALGTFGEIMKYKYQVTYKSVKYLTKAFFQKSNFIKDGSIEIWIPTWMEAEMVDFNFNGFGVSKEILENVRWTDVNDKQDRKNERYTVVKYKLENIPKTQSEYMSRGATYYMPHVVFLNKKFSYKGKSEQIFEDAASLYSWYKTLIKGLETKPSKQLASLINDITKDAKTDEEILKSIFYWIQDNIRYIAFEDGMAGFRPDEAENVCALRYGDCKGMANLARVMLKYKGIDARLTWLGTSHIAYNHSLPTLSVDNHMICTVFLNDKTYFIDPTEEYVALNEYAHRIQGREVLIENGDSFLLKKIPVFKAFHNRSAKSLKMRLEGSSLTGTAVQSHFGESKLNVIRGYNLVENQDKEQAITSFLNNDNKNLTVLNISLPDFNNRDSALHFNYNFKIDNSVVYANDKVFIKPENDKDFYYLLFDDSRKTAYEFDVKYYNETKVEIEIPIGYELDYLPESVEIDKHGYSMHFLFSRKDNVVCYEKLIKIENTVIETTEFEEWNTAIGQLRKAYAEFLIFKKIEE